MSKENVAKELLEDANKFDGLDFDNSEPMQMVSGLAEWESRNKSRSTWDSTQHRIRTYEYKQKI